MRRVLRVAVVAHHVQVTHPEVRRRELDDDLDALPVQMRQEVSRLGIRGLGAHGYPPVQGPVVYGVAVALDQLEQGVGEGVLQARAGAEAVCDRGEQELPFLLPG